MCVCAWARARVCVCPAGDYVPLAQPSSRLKDGRCTDKPLKHTFHPDHSGSDTIPDPRSHQFMQNKLEIIAILITLLTPLLCATVVFALCKQIVWEELTELAACSRRLVQMLKQNEYVRQRQTPVCPKAPKQVWKSQTSLETIPNSLPENVPGSHRTEAAPAVAAGG